MLPTPFANQPQPPPPAQPGDHHVGFHSWRTWQEFARGDLAGTAADAQGLRLHMPEGTRNYLDPYRHGASSVVYEQASWSSPWVNLEFGATEIVASWNASTPEHTWIEVCLQARCDDGQVTPRYVMGRWCAADVDAGGALMRCTLGDQNDHSHAWVDADTMVSQGGHTFVGWRLIATLLRPAGCSSTPLITLLGAMASDLPKVATCAPLPTSPPTQGRGLKMAVPPLSQEVHIGHYPQWDNGGEAWCSATSTAMVVQLWGREPSTSELSWVDPPVDAQVDFTARQVYDYCYHGTGNWSFNTAYAATRGLVGFVFRCPNLAEAEQFIQAGVPLICSVSFSNKDGYAELSGAGYSTNGHLLVITGFTADGDVIVNDPASHLRPDNTQVEVIYRRDQFETAWVGHNQGTCYVIHPHDVALPALDALG